MIHEYEVTVIIRDKTSGALRELTVTEYAYSSQDVMYQAIMNVGSTLDKEEVVKVLRISPPRRLIDVISREVDLQVSLAISRLRSA